MQEGTGPCNSLTRTRGSWHAALEDGSLGGVKDGTALPRRGRESGAIWWCPS